MNKKKDQPVKPKITKQKTVAVKSRIKGGPVKRIKSTATKEKTKGKPAPIVEAGYSLYSAISENSLAGDIDTCSEVLARLKERRKGSHIQQCIDRLASSDDSQITETHSNRLTIVIPTAHDQDIVKELNTLSSAIDSVQSDANAPFNQRLSSSTPDPDKAVYHAEQGNIFQTVPERDSSGPVIKETAGINLPFGFYNTILNTGSDVKFGSHSNTGGFHTREVVNTSSSGFIATLPTGHKYTDSDIQGWTRRDSNIQTYQAYIPRESTGFVTDDRNVSKNDSKGHSSSSSGAKEISQLISKQTGIQSINSSGTDYIVLPLPQGGQAGAVIPPGTPVFQLQNGLFQIRPANVQDTGQINAQRDQIGNKPTAVQHDLGGSYLGVDTFQIPERDNGPVVNTPDNKISSIPQDTLSTITGTDSHHQTITPVSQRTSSVNMTPREVSSATLSSATPREVSSATLSSATPREVSSATPRQVLSVNTEISQSAENKMEDHDDKYERKVESLNDKLEHTLDKLSNDKGIYKNTEGLMGYNTHKQNLSGQNTKDITQSSQGQNISRESQVFLVQTSQGTMQLVPVSVLPSSNVSTAIPAKQLQTLTSSGQNQIEADKQNLATGQSTEKSDVNIPNPWSKVKMDAGLKKLRYLLGELKECGKIGKDLEVARLVKEVEKTLETIPTLSNKFNLMAEIDLCLQPLRNENCQLRRKLRLTNQHLKDKETVKEKAALDFDVLHLQASNTALQKQVATEKETKVKLALELKDLHSQIQRMKIERNKLLAALSEKETDELKIKQECLSESQKFRHEIEQLRRQTEGIEMKHEALEQENHILQISLQQRDTEINKMQEVVNEVKDCVGSLIQELEESRTGDKSFISNNSYSIQKLLRVLGEDSMASFSQKNPGRKNIEEIQPQYYSNMDPSTPRLTKKALASHNKNQTEHRKFTGDTGREHRNFTVDIATEHRKFTGDIGMEDRNFIDGIGREHGNFTGDIGREHRNFTGDIRTEHRNFTGVIGMEHRNFTGDIGDYKTSNSDTEVELNVDNFESGRKKTIRRRGQSLSPHNKRVPLYEKNISHADKKSPKERKQLFTNQGVTQKDNLSPKGQKNSRVAFDFSKTSYLQNSTDIDSEVVSNARQSCNQSEASRYSVTDYFQKYPKHQPAKNHQRSYSQPNYNYRHSNTQVTPASPDTKHSPVRTNDGKLQKVFSPQDNLYQGTYLDNSLSAISDDNISSVSERTASTTTTVNDTSFRRGIAALDANILKLQLALQKTKSMLS